MKKALLAAVLLLATTSLSWLAFSTNRSTSIILVGDILLDRGVREKISEKGYEYPFSEIKKELKKADIAFGNLEGPITARGIPALKKNTLLFRGDEENVPELKNAGFTILNLANNHSMDYGREGITDTMKALTQAGLITVGAGTDRASAREPVYIKNSGTIVGFLGYSAFPTEGYFYFKDKADVAQLVLDSLSDEVRKAKSKCDFLIVSFHWGKEFDFYPTENQKKAAHIALDSGADLVAGHHPHVLQSIEMYKGKPIFYSLGNFVFDRQVPPRTDETILIRLNLKGKKLDRVEILPLKISSCRPVKADSDEAAMILQRLKLYSNGLGAVIEPAVKSEDGYVRIKDSCLSKSLSYRALY